MTSDPFTDLAAYVALPRLTGLALSLDGARLVATMQQPDAKGSRYSGAVHEIPLGAGDPVRLTRSVKGEGSPAFRPDGSLLFTSARPDPDGEGDDATALWVLPPTGEPHVLLHRAGGLSGPVVASGSDAVLLTGERLVGSTEDDDAERRTTRTERKLSAILHTGMPIRSWDHEVGDTTTRLLLLPPGATTPTDLAPDAVFELRNASYSISADGATVATTWRPRGPRGTTVEGVAVIDTATLARTQLPVPDGCELGSPVISPDGRRVAVAVDRTGRFDVPVAAGLAVMDLATGASTTVELGDVTAAQAVWAADSSALFVAGDLHGRGAVVRMDPATGSLLATLTADATYTSLCPSPDGSALYALRTAMDSAPTPVRIDTADGAVSTLATPAPTPPLPGTVTGLDVATDTGASIHAWLFQPPPGDRPAPVMLWIHGGPFASYNAWSWRWNPWVAVARGWTVVLPDPAMSTGYGQECIDRAWPYRADVVWHELETVLDHVLARPDCDETRTACLGGSFGGFMTNWIAGHTDRFGAIVTHAGLWALDQQHATTDAAAYKSGVFGTVAEHPEWYAGYSPHHTVDAIVTPMLIVHGNRDYRVPVSEALRLWWDLVSRWDGPPETLPHRFLQLTGENHWVLSPGNAEVWYDAVLGFCAEHVLGTPWVPSPLL